ncbi:hypothetical protein [Leucobacter salsicius]|uniref:hypothetical protein n=1 Tax=Leucobacter salsicius TaxID=664638 RepID=UPI00034BD29B|nr:hypothetical protein [Leucobacter salsicius]
MSAITTSDLDQFLAAADAGDMTARVIWITGPMASGKTRLADRVADARHDAGDTVLCGVHVGTKAVRDYLLIKEIGASPTTLIFDDTPSPQLIAGIQALVSEAPEHVRFIVVSLEPAPPGFPVDQPVTLA